MFNFYFSSTVAVFTTKWEDESKCHWTDWILTMWEELNFQMPVTTTRGWKRICAPHPSTVLLSSCYVHPLRFHFCCGPGRQRASGCGSTCARASLPWHTLVYIKPCGGWTYVWSLLSPGGWARWHRAVTGRLARRLVSSHIYSSASTFSQHLLPGLHECGPVSFGDPLGEILRDEDAKYDV